MNLLELFRRADRRLEVTSAVQFEARRVNRTSQRGFAIDLRDPARVNPALTLRRAGAIHSIRTRRETGWLLVATDERAVGAECVLEFVDPSQRVLSRTSVGVGREAVALSLPPLPEGDVDALALRLSFARERPRWSLPSAKASVFLGVYARLSRRAVLDHCRGRGVEIGPGPKPQVLPGPDVDVVYVEESGPDAWASLYSGQDHDALDPSLWARYTIGTASALPVDDDSQEFVFSSHVFEHLANPLGHLEHWKAKLAPGGRVLAVVPDVRGCKDYVFAPSAPEEWLTEYERGGFGLSLDHYRRWASRRARGSDPRAYMDAGRSIHAHFYTRENAQALMELAVERLGFSGYELHYSLNHRDFYFSLQT